jgi:pimeloyl-ACP methyl ester carboxylesterase
MRGAGILAVLAWALLWLGPCIADPAQHDLQAVLPDGRLLHFSCSGGGRETILLESGFGATAQAWFKVQPQLAHDARVCSYDRAGYGSSDAGPLPRDGAAIAQDLDNGLRAKGLNGPFVLVAHSAGALYMELFARRRAKDVIGVVMVEPSVTYQDQRFFGARSASLSGLGERVRRCEAFAEGRLAIDDPDERSRCAHPPADLARVPAALAWRTQRSELDNLWTATSDEVQGQRRGRVGWPMVVLTAGASYSGVEPMRTLIMARWTALHDDLAATSLRGRSVTIPGATHLMMIDHPEAVVSAVREVLHDARALARGCPPAAEARAMGAANAPC